MQGSAAPSRRMSDTAVWFDLDGTLCQYERSFDAFVRDALVASGVRDPPENAHEVFAERIFTALETCETDPIERSFEAVADEFALAFDRAEAAAAFRDLEVEGTALAADAEATLDAARERAAGVGLLSNGEGDLQRMKLEAHGLDEAFDAVVISNEVGVRKPDPAIFDAAADALAEAGVEAAEHVYVADEYETDVAPATDAGWRAIHVRNDEGPAASVNRVGSLSGLWP